MKQQQYKISATIRIITNKKSSELVKESIKQDIEDTDSIQAIDDKLVMKIKAKEISELRAKISSHIRAAKVSYDILTEYSFIYTKKQIDYSMSNQEVPPWVKEQLERYEQLQQNLQSVLVQKQQIDLEIIEINKALEELNKSADDVKVYKSAGTVMVSSNKAVVVKDLTESKDLSNTKITVLSKQEERLKASLKEVQEKLDETMKRSTTGLNTQ